MKRRALDEVEELPVRSGDFVASGSFLLDLILGGGWGRGRIVNVVGDRSSGKTLLAVEACANFLQFTKPSLIRYVEAESAFDEEYARSIGMPKGIKLVDNLETVEAVFDDLNNFLDHACDGNHPALYVIDSLDALSDSAEMARGFNEGSYGMGKAKQMSQLFRRLVRKLSAKHCTLFVISQIRDKIGVAFGETKTRSGGHALDFYASQIIWLAEIGKIYREVMKQRRVVGIKVLARCRKNKVGPAHRDGELSILFSYGVDDEETMLSWIGKHGMERALGDPVTAVRRELKQLREARERKKVRALNRRLREVVLERWMDIEDALQPNLRKYE